MGVLFRNAEAIEVLRKVDTLVVDKTGTLTEGKPRLLAILADGSLDESTLLRLAASLERGSEHPLAEAVVKGAEDRGIRLAGVEGFTSVTGKGVRGTVEGRAAAVGNQALAIDLGADLGSWKDKAEALRAEGQTVMFVTVEGRVAGVLGVADPIKESTPA